MEKPMKDGLLERLAALQWDQWRYRTDSLLKSLRNIGRTRDPQVYKLHNQLSIPYKRLDEKQKEEHRQWARKILELLGRKIK